MHVFKVQNLEGQFFLKGNKLTNLSVEQVVDCNGFQDPNSEEACCGVFGGWPQLVFEYVKETVSLRVLSFFLIIFKNSNP